MTVGASERAPSRSRIAALRAAAFLWGFAEATLFFLVPDILLSGLALREAPGAGREAASGVALALVGALAGGALMFAWGATDPGGARRALDSVPAISAEMIDRVERELASDGLGAAVSGPTRGTPYKIYAAQSGALGLSFAAFLAVSVPARLIRFAVVTAGAAWIVHRPLRRWSPAARWRLHGAVWIAVYVVYFWKFWD